MGGGADIKSLDMKKQPIDVDLEEKTETKPKGMYCSLPRLLLVLVVVLVLFASSMLLTYFVMKNHIHREHSDVGSECPDCPDVDQPRDKEECNDKHDDKPNEKENHWPDPWGDKEPVTFDEWRSGFLGRSNYKVTWIEGQNAYYKMENGDLVKYSAPTFDTAEVTVPKSVFDQASGSYYFSEDMRFMLFALNKQKKFRRSFDATYKIYDMLTENWYAFPGDEAYQGKPLELARWTGGRDSSLAFVYQNTLYYQASPFSKTVEVMEEGSVEHNIFAGHTDWVYEEEILQTNKAFWGSSDGEYLIYGLFDESHLPVQQILLYGDDQYSKTLQIAYPKAAQNDTQKTSRIELKVWDKSTNTRKSILPPTELRAPKEHYMTSMSWKNETHAFIVWSDRLQKKAFYTVYDATTGISIVNYVHEEPNGWIETPTNNWHKNTNVVVNDDEQFLQILPKGDWLHVAYFSSISGGHQTPIFLTDGSKEVGEIVGVDHKRHLIYYQAYTNKGNDEHLYRVGTPNAASHLSKDTCITCNTECDNVDAQFASTAEYYILKCRGRNIPWIKLMDAAIDNDYKYIIVRELQDNSAYKDKIEKKAMPTQKLITVPTGNGRTTEVKLWLPPNYQAGNKHPLLVHEDAGPGNNWVKSIYQTGWQTYLSSMEGVIYARVDGRGTRGSGISNRFEVAGRFGTVEIEDQIQATKWLIDNMNVDPDKVAVVGSLSSNSYGGFAALHTLADSQGENDVFKCAIVQNPVTDWRDYDAVYSERFMGKATTEDNLVGYEQTDVVAKVKQFKDKKLMLGFGTADDNVHFLHGVRLMKALNREGIHYKTLIKPDSNHYNMMSDHTYQMYTEFLIEDCFGNRLKDKEYKQPEN